MSDITKLINKLQYSLYYDDDDNTFDNDTDIIHIDDENKKYITTVIDSVLNVERNEEAVKQLFYNVTTATIDILNPSVHQTLIEILTCIPHDVICLICYYTDITIDILMECKKLNINALSQINIIHFEVSSASLFNYIIMFNIFDNAICTQLHVCQHDLFSCNCVEYTFELKSENTKNTKISSKQLYKNPYNNCYYSDEISFMNYYMTRYNHKQYIDVTELFTSFNKYERKDNVITLHDGLPMGNSGWLHAKITRKINNEIQFKHTIMTLKLLINIIRHQISNHIELQKNAKNELDTLI